MNWVAILLALAPVIVFFLLLALRRTPEEESRVYSDSGGDHEAITSLWSVPGPLQVYRELSLPAYSVYWEVYA
jgi:hypothetical protein